MNIKEKWVSEEELNALISGSGSHSSNIFASQVGGLITGSIPFADTTGYLTQDNANLFWDAAEKNLGIGTKVFGATMTQGIQIKTGLAPTANVADTFAFYSDDFAAGNACPHFRTENGTVIGLNQSLFTTASVSFTQITDLATTATNVAAGTTGQRPGGTVGDIRHNSTLGEFELYIAAWHNIARSGANVNFGTIGCGTITVANGSSINLQEDITFTGATGVNLIKFPDALANALSFMEGANPYQTFITTNGSEAIQFHENVLLKGSTEYGVGNKTTGAWAKSIGGGGDYADWATMIAAMPDLIAHAVTVTIEDGTTLTEICDIRNKHGITSAGLITIVAEKYFPTSGVIPTADSATATTLRDAALAAAALGNDYFNGCWVFIVDGTGTDNGFVLITDYVDATGDVVVAAWPGTEPDNTSRYIIVGALIDGAGSRAYCGRIFYNTVAIQLLGIGLKNATTFGLDVQNNSSINFYYCGVYNIGYSGLFLGYSQLCFLTSCGVVKCNTNDNAGHAGVTAECTNIVAVITSGLSDNNQWGILSAKSSHVEPISCFGDGNGAWGTYAISSGQANCQGIECSGAGGNHSDVGTAGDNNADQAAAY